MATPLKKEYDTCPICAEKRRTVSWVTCSKCQASCCRGCVKRFLLDRPDINPICMSCKAQWDFEFLAENTDEDFHNHIYRDHRAKIIVERERSLLPATQPYVAEIKDQERIKASIEELTKEIDMYKALIADATAKKLELRYTLKNPEYKKIDRVNTRFIGHCPSAECKGFLDHEYVCGICKENACRSCRLPKHQGDCDKDVVETVRMLAKDTRSCPNCGVPIFRISGCDQMFCQHEDTPIWLWSGEKKLAKNIRVGDVLIGDDGSPRVVDSLTFGESEMYQIDQRYGESYKVIGKHLLTLCENGDIVDISVEDYLNLSKRQKSRGYHSVYSKGINWESQIVELDPYLLGLWLGDGTSRGDGFSSNDIDIIQYWVNWGIQNETEFVHGSPFYYSSRGENQGKNKPVGYGSIAECTGCKKKESLCCASPEELQEKLTKDPNNSILQRILVWRLAMPKKDFSLVLGKKRVVCKLTRILKALNLIDNKHIPRAYMQNDEETRLNVLAGLIDTDGNNGGTGYRFSQAKSREQLCKDIQDLARSLGFRTTWKTCLPKKKVFVTHGNEYVGQEHIYIRIMGAVGKIPVKLAYKKVNKETDIRNTINVSACGSGIYVGWSVSGGSPRYLLGDGTVTHNCTKCHTPFDWKTGKIETGRIHNPHYYEFQRQNGTQRREPGDVRCGGQVVYGDLYNRLVQNGLEQNIIEWVLNAHRLSGHMRAVVLPHYRENQIGEETNRDLRIKYLINEISEKEWISEIKRREKRREKNHAISLAIVMFVDTMDDIQANILVGDPEDIPSYLVQMKKLRLYTMRVFKKIENRFQNKVPQITKEWILKDMGVRTRRLGMEH